MIVNVSKASPVCLPEKFIECRIRMYRKTLSADKDGELKRYEILVASPSGPLPDLGGPHNAY